MTVIRGVAVGVAIALGISGVVVLVAGQEQGETVTIPAGTTFIAALQQDFPTEQSSVGDEFELRTVLPVRVNGGMEIPVGSRITGEVSDDDDESTGAAGIAVRFTELVLEGDSTEIEIQTELFRFGAHSTPVSNVPVVVPAGEHLAIRLTRPVSVAYRQAPESIHATE